MSTTIVKAAIKVNDEIFTGFDHGECFKFARDKFPIPTQDLKQGFIDSNGNFVDRKQAMVIARESGQLTYETDKHTLISEDLHLNWLNQQAERIAELEEQLKKKPKYNVGDRVYVINEDYEVERDFIESIDIDTDGIEYYTEMYSICWYENQLFATKEEALAKLEKLRGNDVKN